MSATVADPTSPVEVQICTLSPDFADGLYRLLRLRGYQPYDLRANVVMVSVPAGDVERLTDFVAHTGTTPETGVRVVSTETPVEMLAAA